MPFAAHLSTDAESLTAIQSVCDAIQTQLNGNTPDLAVLFLSPHHVPQVEAVVQTITEKLGKFTLIGCTGESIAGNGVEIEKEPAISLWAAQLPGAEITGFHATFEQTPDGILCAGLPSALDMTETPSAIFLLGDPFSCPPNIVIDRLAEDFPGMPLFGGMASGGREPGRNRLIKNQDVLNLGAVGVAIRGGPALTSVVSQGCRPIGTPFVTTRGQDNVVAELGGHPTIEALQKLISDLSDKDRESIQRGLHLGIVMNEYQETFGRGDFLISNVMGLDQKTGAMLIGNTIRTGQTVQFHVRDADTADEELKHLLEAARDQAGPFGGALLFSCNGRGTRLFSGSNHDAEAIQEICGPIPLAGFFAQGELGPVGGNNYIHGFTASIALFKAEPVES